MEVKKILAEFDDSSYVEFICEHCHHTFNGHAYPDKFFYDNELPNMVCPKCGESTLSRCGEEARK